MGRPLASFAARVDLTLDEVVEAASELLTDLAPTQTRYAVAERPDVRTVRYYTSRGLLPKPTSYEGGRARYGFSHLVRLLVIKRLQADHLTLEQVARVLDTNDDDALVRMLALPAAAPSPTTPATGTTTTTTTTTTPTATLAPMQLASPTLALPLPASVGGTLELALEPGGKVQVSAATVADPHKRIELAHSLEQLARWLRATTTNDDDTRQDEPKDGGER